MYQYLEKMNEEYQNVVKNIKDSDVYWKILLFGSMSTPFFVSDLQERIAEKTEVDALYQTTVSGAAEMFLGFSSIGITLVEENPEQKIYLGLAGLGMIVDGAARVALSCTGYVGASSIVEVPYRFFKKLTGKPQVEYTIKRADCDSIVFGRV